MDNGSNSTVGRLENECVYCQVRFDPLSLRSAPLTFGLKKQRANKRKPMGCRGVLIKQITEGVMNSISRRGWSYSQPGHQIAVENSHVDGSNVSNVNINFSGRGTRKMKVGRKTEMI